VLAVNFQLPEKSGFAWARATPGSARAIAVYNSTTRFIMFMSSFNKPRRTRRTRSKDEFFVTIVFFVVDIEARGEPERLAPHISIR